MLRGLVCLGLMVCGGEMGARIDDWQRSGTPLGSTPSVEENLRAEVNGVIRGRPHGQYYAARLNSFGFRGPEITQSPAAGVRRIMCLGASETFGGIESADDEYPAELRKLCTTPCRDEVINVSIVGMSVSSMRRYWRDWLRDFQPDVVVLYPTPFFYLPKTPTSSISQPSAEREATRPKPQAQMSIHPFNDSRFLQRLKNLIVLPEFIATWRAKRAIASALAARRDKTIWDPVPPEPLAAFMSEVTALADLIRGEGVELVLATHPISATSPPRPADQGNLLSARTLRPHIPERALVEFEVAAQLAIREYARAESLPLVDFAAEMNGHREFFKDFVHFSPHGARRAAEIVSAALQDLPPEQPGNR
jgi:hypothetical protein